MRRRIRLKDGVTGMNYDKGYVYKLMDEAVLQLQLKNTLRKPPMK